jgi:hypothetical protein
LVPSDTFVVRSPREDVPSCCHPPPEYEPRRIPADVGLDIPVPPDDALRAFPKVRLVENIFVDVEFVVVPFVTKIPIVEVGVSDPFTIVQSRNKEA